MTVNTSASSKVNVPLILLWVAAVALIGGGYWLLASSTAKQIELYTAGSQDVEGLLTAQSSTTIAGLLLAAGALAVVIALAVHALAVVAARAKAADVAAPVDFDDAAFDEGDDLDDAPVVTADRPVVTEASAPVVASAPAAAAPSADDAAAAPESTHAAAADDEAPAASEPK